MDAAALARAMEPFFTTKGIGKGTGLGLSIVHGLAAQSGGQLSMHSHKGEGATVELWLPVSDRQQIDVVSEVPGAASPTAELKQLRILAVDDDGLVLLNTAPLLEDLGHHVISAASGQQALEALKHQPDLDLVVTDQAMPKMTGLELREVIGKIRPSLPVLVTTGYAEIPASAEPEAQRLSKPFTQDELASAVTETMAASRIRSERSGD